MFRDASLPVRDANGRKQEEKLLDRFYFYIFSGNGIELGKKWNKK
jgi:hypothetical protein